MDIEYNHSRACQYILEAIENGAELAVLPEYVNPDYILSELFHLNRLPRYHLSGWAPHDSRWAEQAGKSAEYMANYQRIARDAKICIVPGTIIERHTGRDGKVLFYNTAYFISSDGRILGHYRKKNIWHPERPHLTSSAKERHEAFDTPIGRVGMLICWDLAFPEAFRELIADGAKVIIIPTFCENLLN